MMFSGLAGLLMLGASLKLFKPMMITAFFAMLLGV